MEYCKDGCKEGRFIVNKHFKLCQECNNIRLHGNKYGKPKKKKKFKHSATIGGRGKGKSIPLIKADEEFYEECFNTCKVHRCEECNTKLPTVFRYAGKVIAKWRYSHIIPKSIAPHLRHVLKNINHLCFDCHQKWENGNKKSMKIYKKNQEKFPNYLQD